MGLTWKSPEELIELYEETTGRLTAEVAALKAKLAASQGREAAMRAALGMAKEQLEVCGHIDTDPDPDCQRKCDYCGDAWDAVAAALATDGSGWVSPETVSGLVEALEEMLRLTPVGQHCVALCRPGVDEHHADCNERGWRDALAAFENSKRGGK